MFKKLIYLVSIVLVLAIGSLAQAGLAEWEAAISGDNPIHWYKFDETSGTDCIDSGSAGLGGTYDGVTLGVQGFFGSETAVRFDWTPQNRVNLTGGTDLDTSWTVEYIVMNMKPPAAQGSMALHDSDSTSVRLAGWTSLAEVGFTLYGVEDYQFTPEEGLTLEDLVIPVGEWMHLTWRRDDAGGMQIFFNGKLVGTHTESVAFPRLRIGGRGGGTADWLDAVLDESVVFDRGLTDDEIIAHAAAAGLAGLSANNPSPADGAKYVYPNVELSWSSGFGAQLHIVYFGDNFEDVNNDAGGVLLETTTYTPGPLELDKVYYWRVDEFDGVVIHKGEVWSFRTLPEIDPNLIGGWKLDEGEGAVAVDSSGGGNDGTIHNADTGGLGDGGSVWVDDPERGMVISFNGADIGAYVSTDLIIPFMSLESDFTWAFWAKQHAGQETNNDLILGNRYGGTEAPLQFIKFTPTRFEFFNDDYDYLEGVNYEPVPGDVWVHHVTVKNGTSLTYYRNGEEAGASTITKTIDPNPFSMGGDATDVVEMWRGYLSDVRLYDRALSQDEILEIMQGM